LPCLRVYGQDESVGLQGDDRSVLRKQVCCNRSPRWVIWGGLPDDTDRASRTVSRLLHLSPHRCRKT
jgi:hypothetical protein